MKTSKVEKVVIENVETILEMLENEKVINISTSNLSILEQLEIPCTILANTLDESMNPKDLMVAKIVDENTLQVVSNGKKLLRNINLINFITIDTNKVEKISNASNKVQKEPKSLEELQKIADFAFENYANAKIEYINKKSGKLVCGIVNNITLEKGKTILLNIKSDDKKNYLSLPSTELLPNVRIVGKEENGSCKALEIEIPSAEKAIANLISMYENDLTKEQIEILKNLF